MANNQIIIDENKLKECCDGLNTIKKNINDANHYIKEGNKYSNRYNVSIDDVKASLKKIHNDLQTFYEDYLNAQSNIMSVLSNNQALETSFDSENTLSLTENNESVPLMDNQDLTDEQIMQMLISLGIDENGEFSPSAFKEYIEKTDLPDSDKEYIFTQLDKGNDRAAIQWLLVLSAKSEYERVKAQNEVEIEKLNDQIDEVLSGPGGEQKARAINELNTQINSLKKEISLYERQYNIYLRSAREWEYDCYLALNGSELDIILEYENLFYELIKYYLQDKEQYKINKTRSLGDQIQVFIYDESDDSFYNWLKSDECHLENKERYIYLIENYQGIDNITYYTAASRVYDEILSSDINETTKERFINAYNTGSFGQIFNLEYSASKYFDSEHLKVYQYIYMTEGAAAAYKYLETFSDYFNRQSGLEKAESAINNIINGTNDSYFLGLLSSEWEGIKLGTEAYFDLLGQIFSKDGLMTDSEYAIMYINNMLSSMSYFISLDLDILESYKDYLSSSSYDELKTKIINGETVYYLDYLLAKGEITKEVYDEFITIAEDDTTKKFIENTQSDGFLGMSKIEWLQHIFKIGVTAGNMLPSVAISLATSGLGGTASLAKSLGLSSMFLYATASSKNEALRDGRSLISSYIYGVLNGASEVATEYLIGGIPGLSRLSNWASKMKLGSKKNILSKLALNLLFIQPGSEVLEEEVQLFLLDPLIKQIAFSENHFGEATLDDALKTALITYISTFQLQAATSVVPVTCTIIKSHQIYATFNVNGQNIDLTYGELFECFDKYGNFDIEKFEKLIKDKLGIKDENIASTETTDIITNPVNSSSETILNTLDMAHLSIEQIQKLRNIVTSISSETNISELYNTQISGKYNISLDTFQSISNVYNIIKSLDTKLLNDINYLLSKVNLNDRTSVLSLNSMEVDGKSFVELIKQTGLSTEQLTLAVKLDLFNIDSLETSSSKVDETIVDETVGTKTDSIIDDSEIIDTSKVSSETHESDTLESVYDSYYAKHFTRRSKELFTKLSDYLKHNIREIDIVDSSSKAYYDISSIFNSDDCLLPYKNYKRIVSLFKKIQNIHIDIDLKTKISQELSKLDFWNKKIYKDAYNWDSASLLEASGLIGLDSILIDGKTIMEITGLSLSDLVIAIYLGMFDIDSVSLSSEISALELGKTVDESSTLNGENTDIILPKNTDLSLNNEITDVSENTDIILPENKDLSLNTADLDLRTVNEIDTNQIDLNKFKYVFASLLALLATFGTITFLDYRKNKNDNRDFYLKLKGNDKISLILNDTYQEPGYEAYDSKDGNLTNQVIVNSSLDTSLIGTYVITYKVTNSNGDTLDKTRTVEVTNFIENCNETNSCPNDDFVIHNINPSGVYKIKVNDGNDVLASILLNNGLNNLNIMDKYIYSLALTSIVKENNKYQNIYLCNNNYLNNEASSMIITNYKLERSFTDNKCFNNYGIFYFVNNQIKHTKVNNITEYQNVFNSKTNNTFVYESLIVDNGNIIDNSNNKTKNTSLCGTNNGLKVISLNKEKTYNEIGIMMKNEGCNTGILLTNDISLYKEKNGNINIIHGINREIDSLIVFYHD